MTGSNFDAAPILVLGTNGKTGRRVAERLRAQGLDVRGCARSTRPRFDWNDRATWGDALAGVKRAYITYQPDLAIPGALDTVSAFFDAARASGIERIVLLSGRGEEEAQAAEEALQRSGAIWTILRCSWFMQNFSESFLLDPIREGTLALPVGDIKEPFVDAEDIADVAVAALTQPGHENRLYELTGPRAISFAEALECIGQASRRNLRLVAAPADAFRAGLLEAGVSTEETDLILYLFTTVLDGRNEKPVDGVRLALDREARSFEDYARRTAASGVWDV
ncbi:NAD(P)H-binding protein (plasmid) [Caballeronia sp. NK8]|uniref:NAD(P)H-binding protein n=1 Tax=Caballeronia sp. NK8 TaxID=140098 RepID=UPI001BB69422|nr:NAD(P)H-binding protein [Caballeronia sp. NK8]BCQ27736.1 NAD(P)H-binding protein [Caballeronia sp. NK8]